MEIPTIDKREELYEYVNINLKPKEYEKKIYSEVYTQLTLIIDMINNFKEFYSEFFKNPNIKIYDPCCGIGNFSIILYYELMNSLKDTIKNEYDRKKHILENILYVGDINKNNIEIYKKIFEFDKFKLNIYEGDTLKIDIRKVFNVNKFDLIITNPPFFINKKIIYLNFILKYHELCNYMILICPKTLKTIKNDKKDLFKHKIKYVNDIKEYKYISKTIKMIYFILDNNENNNALEIFKDKLYEKYGSISTITYNKNTFMDLKNNNDIQIDSNENSVECFVSLILYKKLTGLKTNLPILYIDKNKIKKQNNDWRVITPTYSYSQKFGHFYVMKPNQVHSDSYISFVVNNEEEANNLISYLKTNYCLNKLLELKLGRDIGKSNLELIPNLPLNVNWDDKKIEELFNDFIQKENNNALEIFKDKLYEKYGSISTITYNKNTFMDLKNNNDIQIDSNENSVECFVSLILYKKLTGLKTNLPILYIDKNKIKKQNNDWRVITPTYSYSQKFGHFYVMKPNQVHSDSYISFVVNNEEEANNLISYLKTNYCLNKLLELKNERHITKTILELIPYVPLNVNWDDKKIEELL